MRTGVVGTRERAGFGHPARAGSTPSGGAAPRRCRSTCPCSPRAPGPRATAQRRGRRPPGRSPGVLVGHDGPPRSRHPPQRGALCQPVTTKIQPRRETQDEGWTGGFGRRPPRQESVAGAAARRHRKVKNTGRLGRHPSLRARSIAWTSQRPPEPRTWVRIPAGPSPYAFISLGPLAFHVVRAVESFREPKGRLDHRPLLKDPTVRKWFEAHALRSSLSAEVNLRKLGLFLYRTRLTPKRLVELAKERPEELRDLLIGYATHLHALKKLDSYIAKTQKGVRDWLLFNGVDFRQFPKLRRAYQSESLSRERIPTPEQLRLIL